MSPTSADRFDTAGLRAAVLDSWRSSPTRYREDANVEEDYALGGYRDRLFVELAQNAVDAARAAAVPARMRIHLGEHALVVTNTGAPLDRAGVESLAAMRASSKRSDTTVGRFGVGFAAVLAVTEEPVVTSRVGGVRFSRQDTTAAMRQDSRLVDELDDRPPPVLRLPFPYDLDDRELLWARGTDDEYDTAVVLPWRDQTARDRAVEALRSIDDALFIALPDLVELVVEGAPPDVPRQWDVTTEADRLVVRTGETVRRWALHTATGEWSADDLTPLPTEQRTNRRWSLSWAVPVAESGRPTQWPPDAEHLPGWPRQVLHAPTPTDEVLELPGLLVGDFPVDSSRRRLAEGPATDVMVQAAIERYVEVVREAVGGHGAAAAILVPQVGLVGPLDGRLRDGIRDLLGRSPWLPRASDRSGAAPRELVAVEPSAPGLVSVLGPHLSDLLSPEWLGETSLLRGLGLTSRRWGDVWDVVALVPMSAETWHAVYEAASGLDRVSLEGLPVLLADGRVVRDARQCLAPGDGSHEDALRTLGLAVVEPTAMHPLLERLGVQTFDARVHLAGLPQRVRQTYQHDQAEARELLGAAAEALVGSAVRPGELVELGTTPVPTEQGDWHPASQVVLPGTHLAQVVDRAPVLDGALAAEHGDGWLALGVLGELTVAHVSDLALDPEHWDSLMVDGGDWCEETADLLDSPSVHDLLVARASLVRGIELLEGCTTITALELLGVPEVRDAVVTPAAVVDSGGQARSVRSPAAWWLSEAPLFDGRPPSVLRLPGDDRLVPFFELVEVPGDPDLGLLGALGLHTTVEEWLGRLDGSTELLSAMAEPTRQIPGAIVTQLYGALQRCDLDVGSLEVPDRVRARVDDSWQLVDASDAVVAVAPHHAYVAGAPFIPGGVSLAELLDLDVTDDAWCGAQDVHGTGTRRQVPASVAAHTSVSEYREHDALTIGGRDVDWWVSDDGEVHACTLDGLAHGLAWADGQWGRRFELVARMSAPVDPSLEALDAAYDD